MPIEWGLAHFLNNRAKALNLFALCALHHLFCFRASYSNISVAVAHINAANLITFQPTFLAKEPHNVGFAEFVATTFANVKRLEAWLRGLR